MYFCPALSILSSPLILRPAVKVETAATETEIKDVSQTAAAAAAHSVTDNAFALEILLYDGRHGVPELLLG